MKRPSFQFYPQDWLREESLRLVSVAARGLWIDMIALMHNGDPYGHLVVGGLAIDETALSRLVGETPATTRALMAELEKFRIFSRTEDGAIYSRRMVRDESFRAKRAEYGSLAANHPNASRAGEVRDGGRPKKADGVPGKPLDGVTEGVSKEPLDGVSEKPLDGVTDGVSEKPLNRFEKNPPSSSSSSSSSSIRSVPNGTVPRSRVPAVEPGPEFGDLEPDVQAFLATVAAENKSGKISDARAATLRRDLADVLAKVGDRAAFAYGVREAVKHEAGNVNYALKAASGYSPLMTRVTGRDEPDDDEMRSLADMPYNDYEAPEELIWREGRK